MPEDRTETPINASDRNPGSKTERRGVRATRAVWMGAILLLALLVALLNWVSRVVDDRYNSVVSVGTNPPGEQTRRLHGDLLIADLHADALLWDRDLLVRNSRGQVDVPRLIEGNVAVQVFSTVSRAPFGPNYQDGWDRIGPLAVAQLWPPGTWWSLRARTLHQAKKLQDFAASSAGRLVVIRTAGDLDRYLKRRPAEPKITAAVLSIEGLHALEGDLKNVDRFFDAGFRMMGLAHFFDNDVAGSSWGGERYGLTAFGRSVVARMETLGVIVDLAHSSAKTIDDVLELATRPVVVSHTGVQGTCPGSRNLSDRHLREIAKNGGLIGIGYFEAAVCGVQPERIAAAVRYATDRAGVEHVAIGSDFDGAVRTAFDTANLDQITQALGSEGFTDDEIHRIMGENALRLLRRLLPKS